jgi:small subunit ribosomal protein S3Ae
MAIGKSKRISKGGRKGGKKKVVDPFSRKEWYDIKAPSYFSQRLVGKTIVSRTQGTRIASEELKGRIFEVNLADLQKDEDHGYLKIKLETEEVQGKACLTNFYGMDFTTDKLRSMIRKWQTMIEAHVDVKTTDGYTLRLFAIGFTLKNRKALRKSAYATAAQVRRIRKRMSDIITKESNTDLKSLVQKFIPNSIGKDIEKKCQGIYPLQNVHIRKVKILKKPKFDLTKLMEVHGDSVEDVGQKVAEAPAEAPAQ